MSALKVWLPSNFWEFFKLPVSWQELLSALSLGLVGRLLWLQYGVLRWPNRPPTDLGFPLVGHSLEIFRETLDSFSNRMLQGRKVVLTNFLGTNIAIVDWPLYIERLHRLEVDGEMVSDWPYSAKKLLGPDSILSLPGGKGHVKHKRLRNKILASLSPKAVLAFVPEMIDLVRRALDAMVEETTNDGHCNFRRHTGALAAEVSALPITAGLEPKVQKHVSGLLDDMLEGAFALPIDLGRFTCCGRGALAKKRLRGIIEDIMQSPNVSRRNIISDLRQGSEDGEAFTVGEIVDTVATLMLAGKLTTADMMPALMDRAHRYRDWAQRIAQEPLNFVGCEDDSATLRFVRETLRLQAPGSQYHRRLIDTSQSIDLGEHGAIPPGTTLGVCFVKGIESMGRDFDPERWTPEATRQRSLISFGGNQPHQCVGKNLALLELQIFLRVLCTEYEFEPIDAELVAQPPYVTKSYKDGLKAKISRKTA